MVQVAQGHSARIGSQLAWLFCVQFVAVQLKGPRADCVVSQGTLSYLTSGAPGDENTLDQPLKAGLVA